MSKDGLNPGRIELFGMTSLEERCAIPSKGYSCVYDAIFTCADSGRDGIGSFRTYVGRDKNKKKDGVYEIRVKIVGFKPGRNPNSEKYNDHQIDVLGDIDKMQLLQEANISDLEDEVHIGATGIVTSTEKFPPSFLIHAKQYTDGGASTDEIAVRGRMENNPKWPDPAERLPQQNQVIAFNGVLQSFDSYFPPGKKPIKCVVVDVKDITYVLNPEKKKDDESTPGTQKRNLQLSLRARNRAEATNTSESSQTLPSPSTSQLKGKRKAKNSEDEVNKDVLEDDLLVLPMNKLENNVQKLEEHNALTKSGASNPFHHTQRATVSWFHRK
ncbi:hypothetical protein EDB92DRAFT_1820942 [Lactarius akahatsu]|uniref:Uncharacterized protein n=1 Tax=Lactarius akahatsu TaxID=416441 RepID=A0AAD4L752_9AGAM|nr:hypothetical protein EDB92DRAFT_1820942 [Lactarius akahatsu]